QGPPDAAARPCGTRMTSMLPPPVSEGTPRAARSAAPVAAVKQFLRERHRHFVFTRTLEAFRGAAAGALPGDDQIAALTYGWNNDGFSASGGFLREALAAAWRVRGPVLECGSGLSTLLLGLVAARTGSTVCSLEHDGAWARHVERALQAHRIPNVSVRHAPLRSWGAYSWYGVSPADLPDRLALVVCDGPPGGAPLARYGVLPATRARLA